MLDVLQSNWGSVKIDEGNSVDNGSVHGHSLGSGVGVETLDGEQGLQWGVGEAVNNVEQEEEGYACSSNVKVLLVIWCSSPFGGETTISGKHESAGEGSNS